MSFLKIRNNFAGTMADEFRIGKLGPTILQGTTDPADGLGRAGDIYVKVAAQPRLFIKDAALGWLPSADPSLGHVRQEIATASDTINPKTTYAAVVATTGSTITLPTGIEGRHLIIKDEGGNAGNAAITIVGAGVDTIDGRPSALLDTNYGWVHLVYGALGWMTIGKPSSSPLRRSDTLVITNPAVTSYSFTRGGAALPLNPTFTFVYLNRNLLRQTEYTLAGDTIAFLVALSTDDEVEVVTSVV